VKERKRVPRASNLRVSAVIHLRPQKELGAGKKGINSLCSLVGLIKSVKHKCREFGNQSGANKTCSGQVLMYEDKA